MDNKTRSKTKAIVIALSICAGIVIVGVIALTQYKKSVATQKAMEEVKIEMTEKSEDAEEEVAQKIEEQTKEEPMEPVEPEIVETEESGTLYTVERTVMYKLPNENQDAYVYLPMGCEVEVLAKTENGYTKVRYGLKKGYLKNELLTVEAPEIPEEDDEQTAEAQQAEENKNTGNAVTSTTAIPAPSAEQQAADAATSAPVAPSAPVSAAQADIDAMWSDEVFTPDPTLDAGYVDFN